MKKLSKEQIKIRDRKRLKELIERRKRAGKNWEGIWILNELNDEINFLKEKIKK